MAKFEAGSVLTCGHSGCGCRVVIQEVCECPGGGESYTCICGSPLTPVSDSGS